MGSFRASRTDQGKKQARTATADGLTTGLIASSAKIVVPTSGNANRIIHLPKPRAGHELLILGTATGYELRAHSGSSADVSIKINNTEVIDSSGDYQKELAVAAAKTLKIICISATEWIVTKYSTVGASGGGGTPD